MNEKLDQKFIKKQKTILLKEKQKLGKELKKTDEFPQYGSSDEANSSEVTDFTTQQGLEKKLRVMMTDVYDALQQMEKGKYGICKKCSKPIAKNRLMAFPAATYCVKHSSPSV